MSEDCKKKYIIKVNNLLSKGEKGDAGEDGADGASISLPITTDDVTYNGDSLTDIISQILYIALQITGFSASPSNYEKGQTLTSVSLTWSYNKSIESQIITGTNVVSPSLLIGDRNKIVVLSSITINTIITLTADDETSDLIPVKIATVTLTFLNKLYWGIETIPGVVNSAFVLALGSNELKADKVKSFSINAITNNYIFFALPVAYGVPSFLTNGFNGGFQLESTISLTNASGYTEDYSVYRTTNHSLGLTFVDVE